MAPDEQRGLLRFVTSCSRPPLLGFRYLEPNMCIQVRLFFVVECWRNTCGWLQMAGSVLDATSVSRLPTSATCMNLLKLPPYTSAALIREKLRYAIEEGAGFELS